MNGAVLANLILKVLSEKLYTLAPDLGRIIAGSNFDAFPKDLLEAIACYLKKHASELLEGNMQLSAFAAIGSYLGEDLIGQDLASSLNEI